MTETPVRPADPETIASAGVILREGGLVAMPTETVYGLAADGLNPAAVARIFAAKGRPADNPLILHLSEAGELEGIVERPPQLAFELAAAFWPGPLTLVLRRRDVVPAIVSAGLATVAVRVPAHPVARAIIRACGRPLAAPSANRSGRPSPTLAAHVAADLDGRIAMIVDGGPTEHGIESTVLDLSELGPRGGSGASGEKGGDAPLLLRQGAITREALAAKIGAVRDAHGEALARSPGLRHRHYAPRAKVELVEPAMLQRRSRELAGDGLRLGVIDGGPGQGEDPQLSGVSWLRLGSTSQEYARSLFAALRTLDELSVERILAVTVPELGIGRALMDRLRRAALG